MPDRCCLSYFDKSICNMLREKEQQVSHLKINIMALTCNLFLNQDFEMVNVCCSPWLIYKPEAKQMV